MADTRLAFYCVLYRRTEPSDVAATAGGDFAHSQIAVMSHAPDDGKTEAELRKELKQLREVYKLEQAEMTKVSGFHC